MSVEETITIDGYAVEIMQDTFTESPRKDGGSIGLWLGFPNRRYDVGDEQFPEEVLESRGHRLSLLVEWIKKQYGARVVLSVGMYDHGGVSYYIGGTAAGDAAGWDSGVCGLIFDTAQIRTECPFGDVSDEEIARRLAKEIELYSEWSQGFTYGFDITAPDGTSVAAQWGFYGMDCYEQDGYMRAAFLQEIKAHREEIAQQRIAMFRSMANRRATRWLIDNQGKEVK